MKLTHTRNNSLQEIIENEKELPRDILKHDSTYQEKHIKTISPTFPQPENIL